MAVVLLPADSCPGVHTNTASVLQDAELPWAQVSRLLGWEVDVL